MEELERLKGQIQAMGMSISNAVSDGTLILNHNTNLIPFYQEMHIRDLNFEFEKLESTEGVDSCNAATVTLHTDWLHIKSVNVNVQKSLSDLFSSKEKQENKKVLKAQEAAQEALEAFGKYYEQGEPRKSDHQTGRPDAYLPDLIYRRTVHQQRKSRESFLNSIPARVQVKPMLFI